MYKLTFQSLYMSPKPSLVAELSVVAEVTDGHLQLLIGELVCLQLVDAAGVQFTSQYYLVCVYATIILNSF